MAESKQTRDAGSTRGNGVGRSGTRAGFADSRDVEIARLRKERDESRARERVARAEAEETHNRLTLLARASKRFAASMRSGTAERQRYRRRISAQYAMSGILAQAHNLEEAAPEIMRILGDRLGWDTGVLWTMNGNELRCETFWCARESPPRSFEEACRQTGFPRGVGLPGRAWSVGEPVYAEELPEEDDPLSEAAAEAGLRGTIAFPVRDGGLAGVFEFLRAEELDFDEDLLRTIALLGQQISQFVERRRAEEVAHMAAERDRFRVALSDALRSFTDPLVIQARAARVRGENLGASRVHCGEITDDGAHVAVDQDHVDGVPHLAGRFRMGDFGRAPIGALRDGHTLVVPDVAGSQDLSASERAAYADVAVGAQVCVPLLKEGRLAAILAVHQAEARAWTAGEVTLIEETAEQTWAAVERARAEEALRESEAKYRALFGSIDEGFCTIEVLFDKDDKPVDYRFLQVSPSFERQTGIENAAGRRMREIAPQHEEYWFETYGKIALTGEPLRFQNRAEQLGRWYDVYAFRVEDPQLRRVGILFNDITERRRSEESLRESEQRFRTLVSNIPGAVYRGVMKEGRPSMQFLSDHIEEITGYAASDFVEDRVRWYGSILHPEDLTKNEAIVSRALERREPYVLEYRVLHANGTTRWVMERGSGVFTGSGDLIGIGGAIFDTTELKRTEEERDRLLAREWVARAQAEERRRLARELHDRVAHDMALVHQSLELHETLKTNDPAKARIKMKLARETVKEALHSTRNLSMELRQPEVRQGLEAALLDLLRDIVPPTMSSKLLVRGDEETMTFELRNQLFVILREAVRNAVTHSECEEIVVGLSITPQKVVASVEDDGRGFDVATTRLRGGIESMRERAALAGANLEISAVRSGGARVAVSVPLEERR